MEMAEVATATLRAGRQLVNKREESSGKGDGYPYAMHAGNKFGPYSMKKGDGEEQGDKNERRQASQLCDNTR